MIWADATNLRWAFTLSNAGSTYFEDRNRLEYLQEINLDAVRARDWRDCKEEKHAEFLVERRFDWSLVRRVGVPRESTQGAASKAIRGTSHRPPIQVMRSWYCWAES